MKNEPTSPYAAEGSELIRKRLNGDISLQEDFDLLSERQRRYLRLYRDKWKDTRVLGLPFYMSKYQLAHLKNLINMQDTLKKREIGNMPHQFKFDLGVEATSVVTGFKGIITSRSQHLNGCDRYWIQPKVGKDGKLPEGTWFDEGEIEVTSTKKLPRTNNDRGGFPSKVK